MATVVALIQLTQGGNVGTAGQALIGTTGTSVSVANNDNTNVASWKIDLVYVPQGSALSTGTLASANSNTPSASFTPDVTGSYRLVLTVWDTSGQTGTFNTDIRNFGVKETGGRGFLKPPAQIYPLGLPPTGTGLPTAKPDEMNFGGQPNGWSGTTGNGLMDDVLAHVDKTGILTSSAPADVTKAAAAVGTSVQSARADHKHDVSTATAGAAAVGDSAAEGTATSLARSDHKHSFAAGTPVAVDKSSNSAGSATTFARSDHKHDVTTATVTDITDSTNAEGTATSLARSDHTHSHGTRGGGTLHSAATTSTAGFMSAVDKAVFDLTIRAIKSPVRAATTANITLSNTQTIDGVSLVAGDRVLVKDQSTGSQNGIYDVVSGGAWTRSVGFTLDAQVRGGLIVPVSEGTVNGNRVAMLTTDDPITIGTTALVFAMDRLPPLTSTAPADVTKASAAVGTSTEAARADHKHDVTTATPAAGAVAIGNSAAEGAATTLARSDHQHTVTAGTPVTLGTANAAGSATTFPRSDHVHDHGSQSTGTHHAVATTSLNGFMSSGDKANFDLTIRSIKSPVRAATTANITLSGTQTVDGVALVAGNRCLVKDQSTGSQNGIYDVASGAWTRSVDADADTEVRGGMIVPVSEGTVNGNRVAMLTTDDPITIGTTALVFAMDRVVPVTSTAPVNVDKSSAAVGTSTEAARQDHKHDVSTATPATGAVAVGNTAAEGTATTLARSDHQHTVTAAAPVAIGTANAAGSATTFVRSDHVHDHGSQSTGTHHAVATSSLNGFMSSGDKANFDLVVRGVKGPVRAATTANITLSNTQTIDGVSLVAGDRVLVKNQSTGSQNGIYDVVSGGAWTRSVDFDADTEVRGGTVVAVSEGTVNGDRTAQLTTNDPITIGTTALTFVMRTTLPGTTGNIPFHNGVDNFTVDAKLTYDDTNDILTAPGVQVTEDFYWQGDISPSQITADQNDYNPTNLATSTVLRLTSDATRNITGLQGGADGRIICLLNVGSNDIVLVNESASSTAGNRFTLAADFTMPPNESILLIYDSTSSRWRCVADATRQVLLRTQFGAADFDDPATDWATTAAAAIAQDTTNVGLTVRRFDDTADEGVGWDVLVPAPCTKVRLTFVSRAQTAPAANRTVGLAFKKREIPNNASVPAWASTTLTDLTLPSNATFQRSSQTVAISTLGLTANLFYQIELVRQNPTGGTELVGDWTLFSLVVEWLA